MTVAFGDHPLHQGDVGAQVFDDGFLVQVHGAAGGGTFGGGVGELKGLFDFQVGQAFDFEDAAGEDVLLALLGDGEVTGLDGVDFSVDKFVIFCVASGKVDSQ